MYKGYSSEAEYEAAADLAEEKFADIVFCGASYEAARHLLLEFYPEEDIQNLYEYYSYLSLKSF